MKKYLRDYFKGAGNYLFDTFFITIPLLITINRFFYEVASEPILKTLSNLKLSKSKIASSTGFFIVFSFLSSFIALKIISVFTFGLERLIIRLSLGKLVRRFIKLIFFLACLSLFFSGYSTAFYNILSILEIQAGFSYSAINFFNSEFFGYFCSILIVFLSFFSSFILTNKSKI